MASKKFIGVLLMGLAGLSLPAVIASTGASAEEATTGTSIVTEELCTWYMIGAPAEISLEPTLGVVEYVGDPIAVSADFAGPTNLNVYSSGNVTFGDRDSFGQCTFYSVPRRPIVTVSIAAGPFIATAPGGPDLAMNFSPVTGNEFKVDVNPTCLEPWDVTSAALRTDALSRIITQIPTVGEVEDRVTIANDRCATDLNFNINIPGGVTPAQPGATYTWAGPAFTTALSTDGAPPPA